MDASATGAALEELAREHAALRRVATLVAREPSRAEVFAVVIRELGELLGAQRTTLLRVESPDWARVEASWSAGAGPTIPVGHRGAIDGRGILGRMLRVAAPVRIEDFDEVGGKVAALMRELGIRSAAAGPIILRGRVWGALSATWPERVSMPVGAEERVAAFAELVAQAIENAETREELAASRARLVQAADEARRRIERDLHDGAQQRLVAATLELTLLERRLARDPDDARARLARVREQLECGLAELRDLARGIHPAILTERGLEAALDALVQRAAMTVELRAAVPERLDAAIEAAAYFLVSEALTNVAKYAHADIVSVRSRRPVTRSSWRSPTTAWAAPIPSAAPACAAWSTASARSAGAWSSAARPEKAPGCARTCRRTCSLTQRPLSAELRVVRANDRMALAAGDQPAIERPPGGPRGGAPARRVLPRAAVRDDADVDTVVAKTPRERRLHRS